MCTLGVIFSNPPLLFKNRDVNVSWSVEENTEYFQGEKLKYFAVHSPNFPREILAGINEKGVSVVVSNIIYIKDEKFSKRSLMKRILDRAEVVFDIPDIVSREAISKFKQSGTIIALDKKDQAVILEIAYNKLAMEVVSENFAVRTNHYIFFDKLNPHTIKSSQRRYNRMKHLLAAEHVENIEKVKDFLKDHSGFPSFSICRHGTSRFTRSSYIIVPRKMKFYYLSGHPCKEEYKEIDLDFK